MWFKQTQIFQLSTPVAYDCEKLAAQLAPLAFTSCLPSFPSSHGWISAIDEEDAPLVHGTYGYMMICLQFEEKILPTTVIRQELDQKIKEIEANRERKVYQKEKYALKDEIILTLLPRAFSKFSRIHAYFDTKNNWLIIDTVNAAKTEKFLEQFKKSFTGINLQPIETEKLGPILSRWLINNDYPKEFAVEKACVLRDPNQQSRVIRCQQQNLFASSIQALIKDGCEVQQLALTWQDRVNFVLLDSLLLQSIKFNDEIIEQTKQMEPETKQQQFAADFLIMAETISALLKDLLPLFHKAPKKETPKITTTTSEESYA